MVLAVIRVELVFLRQSARVLCQDPGSCDMTMKGANRLERKTYE